MNIFKEIAPLRAYLHNQRQQSSTIGLVPTMGALHQGHLDLIRRSREDNTITVCSIYVNPSQFNNPVDFQKYPRTLGEDIRLLEAAGCDVLFSPEDKEMYRGPSPFTFEFGETGNMLEGKFRPGHFNGVAMVVSKLFNIIKPDRAYFGLKDYQQLVIISQLVKALQFDLQIVPVPIVRESDGLAMSSRNRRLTSAQRQQAAQIYQCLLQMRKDLLLGRALRDVKQWAETHCAEHEIKLEYAELADRDQLNPLGTGDDLRNGIILIAAYLGEVRLIDNLFMDNEY